MHRVRDRRVLLGVGGGIAAYKACEVVRRLVEAGAHVSVAMTPAATRFVAPLTFQALSRQPVATDLLDAGEDATIGHIHLAERADVVLIAPATADLIARLAHGRANDMVTAAVLATRAPVVVAPAMNTNMFEHPAVQENLERLRGFGYRIVPPDVGELACGTHGAGRLPDAEDLIEQVAAALSPQDLRGKRVLVSAGPTREAMDPVRFLSNRSSGRMGYALAAAAARRGATVTLVSGPVSGVRAPRACSTVTVETAEEMRAAMRERTKNADFVLMVAAVADYRPRSVAPAKIKKGQSSLSIELERTPDILSEIAAIPGERVVVGFAAETDDIVAHAQEKLRRKGIDLIVANDVSRSDAGFDVETNRAVLIARGALPVDTGTVSKAELADLILDRAVALLAERKRRSA